MSDQPNWLQPTYDPAAVQPMRDELVAFGFQEMLTPEEVDAALGQKNDENVLVMVNSVCGCAAGSARPGIGEALQHSKIPDRMVTVFAGQDKAAVNRVREGYLNDFPPSSPCIAMLKNGEPVFIIHRHHIEGRSAEDLAAALTQAFDQTCERSGPSITPEQYAEVNHARACGSKIPRFDG